MLASSAGGERKKQREVKTPQFLARAVKQYLLRRGVQEVPLNVKVTKGLARAGLEGGSFIGKGYSSSGRFLAVSAELFKVKQEELDTQNYDEQLSQQFNTPYFPCDQADADTEKDSESESEEKGEEKANDPEVEGKAEEKEEKKKNEENSLLGEHWKQLRKVAWAKLAASCAQDGPC